LFFTLAFLFMTGSLIGWVIEVIYRRLFSQKHWVNPGYLTGPCLPLYGICLCMLYLTANAEQYIPIGNVMIRKAVLFVIMALMITATEYAVGMVCLKVTKVRLWDYSNHKGNIQGVICPLYTFYWYLLGAVYYFAVHFNILQFLYTFTQSSTAFFILGFAYGIFAVDIAYSAQIMKRIRRFAAESRIIIRLDELREDIYTTIKKYGKPRFLLSLPTGVQLREMLEKYREEHFSKDIIKERLHIPQKKGRSE